MKALLSSLSGSRAERRIGASPGPPLTESDKALSNGAWKSTFLFGSVQREDGGAAGGATRKESERKRDRQQKRKGCHGNSAGSLNIDQNARPSSSAYFIF